jgi:hypothetical protein
MFHRAAELEDSAGRSEQHTLSFPFLYFNISTKLEDPRNLGEYSCNPGDGTDQRVQFLMFMMMMMMTKLTTCLLYNLYSAYSVAVTEQIYFAPCFVVYVSLPLSISPNPLRSRVV